MTDAELRTCLKAWSKDRMAKSAKQMVEEFRQTPERLETLHNVAMIPDKYPHQEYSSYLVSHLYHEIYTKQHPARIKQLIDHLFVTENHTVRRNLLKVVVHTKSTYREGEILDLLLKFIMSADEAIAVRSYAFSKIMQYLKVYPELRQEIDSIIDAHGELFTPPAMRSCLKRYGG
jgi:vacuolar-type H+-ATPase catalytic subunit A/Vma1